MTIITFVTFAIARLAVVNFRGIPDIFFYSRWRHCFLLAGSLNDLHSLGVHFVTN